MFTHSIDPTLLHLGPFEIRYYGLFFAIGILLSYHILGRLIKKRNIDLGNQNQLYDIAFGEGGLIFI